MPEHNSDQLGSAKVDVFSYPRHFFHQLAMAHDLAAPIQIELHTGLNCDLYRCPHCYGFGQAAGTRQTASAQDIVRALDDLPTRRTTIILSGITTDPMTHPEAAEIIRAIRLRGFSLGVYTKGIRLDEDARKALIEPVAAPGKTWITLSIDATTAENYILRHNIPPAARDGATGTLGADYFKLMCSNLTALRRERDAVQSSTEIRAAFLLFDDGDMIGEVREAVTLFSPLVDMMRFALPQIRNDGELPGKLPTGAAEFLAAIDQEHAGNDAVRVLVETASPQRNNTFSRCYAQRYQITIDRSGDVFPCPQVAVHPYRHLAVGNIRTATLRSILQGEKRKKLFNLDVDSEMKCRICDRKDEALNGELHTLASSYLAEDEIF